MYKSVRNGLNASFLITNLNTTPKLQSPFADFLYQLPALSKKEKQLAWLSTHPGAKERAEYIIKYSIGKTKKFSKVLTDHTWQKLNKKVKEL